jgi:hypothetical protein
MPVLWQTVEGAFGGFQAASLGKKVPGWLVT